MASPLSYDPMLLSGSDDFLYRIMQDYKGVIKHVANRFRHLDSLYDTEDLEQEAFFGVRLACNSWAHARAINMQFRTYLTWHISRHFQGRFHGEDKVVDILDEHGHIRVSIPWSKYRKTGRTEVKARGFSTRIRSLLVYYDDPAKPTDSKADRSSTDWHPVHNGEDTIVDVLDQTGTLIVTVPRRSYLHVQDLIQDLGYTTREYSIYDPRPTSTDSDTASSPQTPVESSPSVRSRSTPHTDNNIQYVVDVYTRRDKFLTRIPMTQYHRFRAYFPKYRLKTRIQNPRLVPEPLEIDADPSSQDNQPTRLLNASAS